MDCTGWQQTDTTTAVFKLAFRHSACAGEMLVSTISEFYDDPRNRPGVVDLCQKLGMLPEMLAEQPFHLDLHVLAAQRGHLRLNDWLLEQRNGPNKDALVQVQLTCSMPHRFFLEYLMQYCMQEDKWGMREVTDAASIGLPICVA